MAMTTIIDVILRGFLPLVIAGLGVYIAYQQYQTNRQKLELDLYDRRIKIYNYAMELVLTSSRMGYEDIKSKFGEFDYCLHEAYFLFDEEVSKRLEEIWNNANTLIALLEKQKELEARQELTQEVIEEIVELRKGFAKEIKILRSLFYPYLYFANIYRDQPKLTNFFLRGLKKIPRKKLQSKKTKRDLNLP